MKKTVVTIVVVVLVGILAMLAFHLNVHRRIAVARVTDETGNEALVTEQATGFMEWKVELCWRQGQGPWMTYLLDGDAFFWRSVELSKASNLFEVKHQQTLVARVNTLDGSIDYPIQKLIVDHPNSVVTSDDPFDRANRVDSLSVGWANSPLKKSAGSLNRDGDDTSDFHGARKA